MAGAALFAAVVLSSNSGFAGQVASQFYHGTWNCTLDGRSSKMTWKVVGDTQTTCSGGLCSVTHGVKEVGSFRDSTGPWVPLTLLGTSTQSITFRHADGNKWYLARSGTRRMDGHSNWQGNQYPLSCSR
jgi:hypothetical protein